MSARFVKLVERSFAFLEDLGFRRTSTEPGLVEYESDRAFVNLSWDVRSGELNALLGLVPRTGQAWDKYALADILGVAGLPASDCRPAQVAEERRLEPFIARLAGNIRTHAQPALLGDRAYFRRLEAFRAATANAQMREMKLRQVRAEVEQAWQERQFERVVSLYTSVEDALSESELSKLEYAKRQQSR